MPHAPSAVMQFVNINECRNVFDTGRNYQKRNVYGCLTYILLTDLKLSLFTGV